jgi:hypothetical protein
LKSHHILSLEFSYSTTFYIRLDLPNTFDIWKFASGFHCFLKAAKPNQKFMASDRKSGNLIKKDLHIMFLSHLRDAPLSAEWKPKPYLESN